MGREERGGATGMEKSQIKRGAEGVKNSAKTKNGNFYTCPALERGRNWKWVTVPQNKKYIYKKENRVVSQDSTRLSCTAENKEGSNQIHLTVSQNKGK